MTDSEEIIRTRRPLAAYFPETIAVELQRYPRMSDLRVAMEQAGFTGLQETTVEHAYTLTDPSPYRHKTFSSLHFRERIRARDRADGMRPAVWSHTVRVSVCVVVGYNERSSRSVNRRPPASTNPFQSV